jgi:hypothetical protein
MTVRIKPYPARDSNDGKPTIHYAVFEGERLIAFCHHESSAIAVRDDVIRRAGLLNESR